MAKKRSSGKQKIDEWQVWAYRRATANARMGFGITLIGTLWWANSIGAIILEPFWPIMLTLAGILWFLKGMLLKNALLRHWSE